MCYNCDRLNETINLEDAKMTRIIILTVTAITLVWLPNCFAADSTLRQSSVQASSPQAAVNEPNDTNSIRSQTSEISIPVSRAKPRVDVVTMADFYMRDGNAVSGKLLSDESTQIVIEQLLDSTIITKTYSKREIDTRTLKTRPVPESQYYTRLGEYFAARTWDFRDDPDDFIGAIRCYEKAKQSLQASDANADKIAEIDKTIQKLKNDRDVWTAQVESRAKLKKLEYDAEAENRLKKLESQVAESNVRLGESIKYLDKSAEDMKGNYGRLEKSIADLNKDFVQQIQNLQVRIANDEVAINDLWLRLQIVGRPPAGGGK
jgi:hypothetical protein